MPAHKLTHTLQCSGVLTWSCVLLLSWSWLMGEAAGWQSSDTRSRQAAWHEYLQPAETWMDEFTDCGEGKVYCQCEVRAEIHVCTHAMTLLYVCRYQEIICIYVIDRVCQLKSELSSANGNQQHANADQCDPWGEKIWTRKMGQKREPEGQRGGFKCDCSLLTSHIRFLWYEDKIVLDTPVTDNLWVKWRVIKHV